MTRESLLLFQELLVQVRVSPFQKDSDQVWDRVKKAKDELQIELGENTEPVA